MLAGAVMLGLAPFLGKAFHVDEPLFIWMARHIQEHPLDPYGFSVNWYGTPAPMAEVMRNPPLVPYVMAVWAAIAGWSEWSLHALFLAAAVAAVLGTYSLASSLCRRPVLAACAAAASPAFFVSSTTVMCDVPMLALFVWSLAWWVRGIDAGDRRSLGIAAMLGALAVLTKYNGAILMLLFAVYAWRKRAPVTWMAYASVPVVALAACLALIALRYGAGTLGQAITLAAPDQSAAPASAIATQTTVTLAFVGGCFITVLFSAFALWPRWTIGVVGLAAGVGWIWAPVLPGAAGADPLRSAEFCVFAVSGAIFVAVALRDFRRNADAGSLLLLVCAAATVIFSCVLSWSVSARYLLPLAPVSGILIARAFDARPRSTGIVTLPIVTAAFVSLCVAASDAREAASAKSAAAIVAARHAGRPDTLWYEGHWGFQYYIDLAGAKALDFDRPLLATGDVMVIPGNNANTQLLDPKWARSTETVAVAGPRWVSTLNPQAGAGFYSSVYGALPFAIGPVPDETYVLATIGPK